MSLSREDLERLSAPSFLDGIVDAPVADLRQRRDECQRAEVVVSYLRRVIQGGIDLVEAEISSRGRAGGSDVGRLVEELPSILASPGGPRREPAHVAVPTMAAVANQLDLSADLGLEELVAPVLGGEGDAAAASVLAGGLLPGANVCSFTDEELAATLERLRREEGVLSRHRRALHDRIDELQAAIVERYKSGSADPDTLLH